MRNIYLLPATTTYQIRRHSETERTYSTENSHKATTTTELVGIQRILGRLDDSQGHKILIWKHNYNKANYLKTWSRKCFWRAGIVQGNKHKSLVS
jgi:hypothetical protein